MALAIRQESLQAHLPAFAPIESPSQPTPLSSIEPQPSKVKMPKRQNENGQMRKRDYEAMENSTGCDNNKDDRTLKIGFKTPQAGPPAKKQKIVKKARRPGGASEATLLQTGGDPSVATAQRPTTSGTDTAADGCGDDGTLKITSPKIASLKIASLKTGFKKVSAKVLSDRKIVKARRPPSASPTVATAQLPTSRINASAAAALIPSGGEVLGRLPIGPYRVPDVFLMTFNMPGPGYRKRTGLRFREADITRHVACRVPEKDSEGMIVVGQYKCEHCGHMNDDDETYCQKTGCGKTRPKGTAGVLGWGDCFKN